MDLRYLPPLLAEVRAKAGDAAVLRLIAEFGGQEIVIPRNAAKGHLIASRCGLAVEQALVALRGGEKVDIPNAAACRSRKAALLAMDGSGMTRNQQAKAAGVTSRYARRVCKSAPAPLPLFDRKG
jgi:hypothetical protein